MNAVGRAIHGAVNANEASALASSLAAGLEKCGLDLDADAQRRLLAYVELLDKWNRVGNLVGPGDPATWLRRHVLDSLSVLAQLPAGSLVDIGSGAGLPGLVLAIARPGTPVTLLESRQRKAVFLRQVTLELALPDVEVVPLRSEQYRGCFDVVICRALGDLSTFVRMAAHLRAPDGCMLAMKSAAPERDPPGLAQRGFRVDAVRALRAPEPGRRLVILRPAQRAG